MTFSRRYHGTPKGKRRYECLGEHNQMSAILCSFANVGYALLSRIPRRKERRRHVTTRNPNYRSHFDHFHTVYTRRISRDWFGRRRFLWSAATWTFDQIRYISESAVFIRARSFNRLTLKRMVRHPYQPITGFHWFSPSTNLLTTNYSPSSRKSVGRREIRIC